MLKKLAILMLFTIFVSAANIFPSFAEGVAQTQAGQAAASASSDSSELGAQDSAVASEQKPQTPAPAVQTTDLASTTLTSGQSSETSSSISAPAQNSSAVIPEATTPTLGVEIPSEVQTLIQNGELLKAREELIKLWKESSDASGKDQIEIALSDVDTQLLHSKDKFPGILEYQVKPGDSLYVIAKKNKTSVRMIQGINGLQSDVIRPGQKLRILRGNFSIIVNKTDNVLKLYLDEQFFKRYSVATGATKDLTPVGTFTINNKLEHPTWFKTGVKAIAPGAPENMLGTRWLGFSKPGFGIHGTTLPESIGKHATSGCVRMLNSEVEELYDLVPAGTKVTITE